ncbi:helix-turn-helix domain-containing protein [Mesorhizobium sp. LHD-90]|uniref:TetR/AcrR family transcriptional regulator n=1 Tax=Mesorhizobium sp. LHD-90 TaxID=3071414 RepID=UPI0027DF50DD|nr:helix-turn-helix domain-containing protein [Mesorhizobium sp. LHD-90]MDQ6434799.1 helix-turn-helix domain-containing protein [Mesorhizobium sp. LHD-90]
MPRKKILSDADALEAALEIIHGEGPEALTFSALAKASGLSGATLVQRFGGKERLKQAALLHAWDALDKKTAWLAAEKPKTPEGAIALLVALSGSYGGIEAYAEGLMVLREDFRDPVLRARGAAWKVVLCGALDACFAATPGAPQDIGLLLASHWQGSLLWWGFGPDRPVQDFVADSLRRFMSAVVGPSSSGTGRSP